MSKLQYWLTFSKEICAGMLKRMSFFGKQINNIYFSPNLLIYARKPATAWTM